MNRESATEMVAAFDIGSDTVRGLLAALESDGTLRVIARAASMTALGQGLSEGSDLCNSAIDATVRFVSDILEEWSNPSGRPSQVFAVATAAVRDAADEDADRLFSRLSAECGVSARIVHGREEARLAWLGAISSLDEPVGNDPVVVDIGGRSSEFVTLANSVPSGPAGSADDALEAVSIPVGARSLTERFLGSDPPAPEERDGARRFARDAFAPGLALAAGRGNMIVVGGTATAARMLRGRSSLSHAEMAALECKMCDLTLAGRRALMPFDPERAGIICGGLILLTICAEAAPEGCLSVSDGGVREGLLLFYTGAPRLLK